MALLRSLNITSQRRQPAVFSDALLSLWSCLDSSFVLQHSRLQRSGTGDAESACTQSDSPRGITILVAECGMCDCCVVFVGAGTVTARDTHVSHRLRVIQSWQQATVVHAAGRCHCSASVDVVADVATCTHRLTGQRRVM